MSSFLTGMEIASSSLTAQRTRLNVVSSNLANAETTRTADGGPYIRQVPVFRAAGVDPSGVGGFGASLDAAISRVEVAEITDDNTEPVEWIFEPGHPDANPDGYVAKPNVNVVTEMVDMLTASRSYEASATAFETLKGMAMRALSIGG